MISNPYTLLFGKEPAQEINRAAQIEEIYSDFISEKPSLQAVMIAGVRGSGKTVFMTSLSRQFEALKDWVVVELNPTRDMLTSLASKLSSDNTLARIFKNAEINLSFFGFGLGVTTTAPVTDIETALTQMLQSLKKHNKKLLITIDEVAHTEEMREFASAYQIFVRQNLPVFLLMTGVYENIDKLQNDKVLTFLYRMPRIDLQPLNIGSMAENYRSVIGVPEETAREMARTTMGYSFAFQVYGYYAYREGGPTAKAISETKSYLQDYSYRKIWEDLSEKDRFFLFGIAKTDEGKLSNIRETLGTKENELNQYRTRMIRRGLISGETHGRYRFTLPFFKEFVLDNYYE